MNWTEAADTYVQVRLRPSNASPNTVRSYRWAAKALTEWLRRKGLTERVSGLTQDRASLFQSSIVQRMKASSARECMNKLNAISNWMVATGDVLKANPFANLPRIRTPQRGARALTREQEIALIHAFDELDPMGRRDRAFATVLLHTGLRVTELLTASRENVTIEVKDGHPLGRIVVMGKGSRERSVPLNRIAAQALLKWLTERDQMFPQPELRQSLWINTDGTPLRYPQWKHRYRAACDAADIPRHMWGTHKTRHTFATRLMEANVHLGTISRLMGHADPKTTASTYLTHDDALLADALEKRVDSAPESD